MDWSTEVAPESRDPWLSPAFVGVARLPLGALNFEHGLFKRKHRPVSEKVVGRLQIIFRREGIVRAESKHWIDALVDPDNLRKLDQELAKNSKSKDCLRLDSEEHPLVDLGPVDCLQGVHRILAASDLLNPNDRWWPVRLYRQETLPQAIKVKIIEGSINEQPYSDGEIFRKIREYQKDGNVKAEEAWCARLSPTKQKDLKQLLKNPSFAKAFDDLMDIPGLWYSVKLGTLHRFFTLRCDEELLRYLGHIKRTWKGVLDAAGIPSRAVDQATVEKLELLAPSVSEEDRKLIQVYMNSGDIFPTVSGQLERDRTFQALTTIPGLIPSLRSFFENLKYLEPCSTILKRLCSPKEKRTIFQCLSGSYFKPSELSIEYSEGKKKTYKAGDTDRTGLWLAYVQLWAFCMRHFPAMTQIMPRKEPGKEKPTVSSNPALWHYLGELAINLGFRTEQAENFSRQDPHRSLAEQSLENICPGLSTDDRLIGKIANALKQADSGPTRSRTPDLTREQNLSIERRCNRPFNNDFVEDSNSLFIPLIYEAKESHGPNVSPFFVKRDTFISFFGNKYGQPLSEFIGEYGYENFNDITMGEAMDPSTSVIGAVNSGTEADFHFRKLQEDLHTERQERNSLQAKYKALEVQLRSLQDETPRLEQERRDVMRADEQHVVAESYLESESSTPIFTDHPGDPCPQDDLQKAHDVMKSLQSHVQSSEQEVDHLKHELKGKGQQLEKLIRDLNEEKRKVASFTKEWDCMSLELQNKNQALEHATNAWKESNARSAFKIWRLLSTKSSLKKTVTELEAAYARAKSQIDERKIRDMEDASALQLEKGKIQEMVKQLTLEKDGALEEVKRLEKVLQSTPSSLIVKNGGPSDYDQARKRIVQLEEELQHEAEAYKTNCRSLEERLQEADARSKELGRILQEREEGIVLDGILKLFQVAIAQPKAPPQDFLAFFAIRMHYAQFIVPVPREGAASVVNAVIQAVTEIGLADRAEVAEEDEEKWVVASEGKIMPKSYWKSPQFVMRCIEMGIGITLGPKSVVIAALAQDSGNAEIEVVKQITEENGKKRGVILRRPEEGSAVVRRQYVQRETINIEEADEDEDRHRRRKVPGTSNELMQVERKQ